MFLLFQCVSALINQKNVLNIINNDRIQYNLEPVTYNYDLQNELELYREVEGSAFFFEKSNSSKEVNIIYNNVSFKNATQNLNGQFILEYSTFEYFKNKGWKFMYRDSHENDISKIIKFRSNQKKCFNIKKCSNDSFSEHVSCLKNPPQVTNSLPCSHAFYYYPMHILKSLKEISIVEIFYHGPAVPQHLWNIQNRTFFMYGRYNELLTDNPILS